MAKRTKITTSPKSNKSNIKNDKSRAKTKVTSRQKTTNVTQKKTRKSSNKKGMRWQSKLFFCLLWCGVVFGLILGGFWWYCAATLPDFSKAIYVERERGVKILAKDGREITSYGALFAEPVDVDYLPSYVYQAVIDTEDRRFFKHSGVDYIGFIRAIGVNIIKRRYAQGASSLTQQVAKNLFLTREKSIKRKVQEFMLARYLEKTFTKKQILNIYLNRVFFGSGAYGLNAAAKRFFNKKAKDLNLREASILAGSLKAPSKYNYLKNKKEALERSNVVLSLMQRAGTITEEEKNMALKQKIGGATDGMILGGRYFGDYVMNEIQDMISDIPDDLIVRTTLDYDLQQRAEYLLRKNLREHKKDNVSQGAVIILDNNGAIRAMVGGADYNKSQFNRATQALRQAGSSFKLFVYLRAFEQGFKTNELLSDEPLKIGEWEPQNYDKQYHGAVSLKTAFAKSLNVATVDLATYLTLEDIIALAVKLGITTEIKAEPSLVLGANEVRVIEMAAAYTAVFNGGYAVFPYGVEGIVTTDKDMVFKRSNLNKNKVLDNDVLVKINELLREVVVSGTGKAIKSVKNAKGKTGTSQNYRDAWFIGTNGKYTAAVWVGNDDNSPMKEIGGGKLPAKIFNEIMR